MKNIFVAGGDLRQLTVSSLLESEFNVEKIYLGESSNAENIENADIVVLPMPVSADGINLNAPMYSKTVNLAEFLQKIPKTAIVLGGKIPKTAMDFFAERNIKAFDYLQREDLAVKNAVPTSEGAIEIAISKMPVTIFGSRVLIVGFGRIGKVLAEKLKLLGAEVTVSARKTADFAWIDEKGLKSVHTDKIGDILNDFDLIVNTVPAMIFDAEKLKNIRKDALLLDLASKPGGVDFDTAKALGINTVWALALPGKTAPVTSGKIIKETIINILSETEVLG